MRKEFQLTEEQRDELLKAAEPVPVMYLSGGQPMYESAFDKSMRIWNRLGKEMGFFASTVLPVSGKSNHFFTAEVNDDIPL